MKNHTKIFHDTPCRSLIGPKSLHIRFDKVDGFVRVYGRTRHLLLFGPEKYYVIYNRIRYLISQINDIISLYSN